MGTASNQSRFVSFLSIFFFTALAYNLLLCTIELNDLPFITTLFQRSKTISISSSSAVKITPAQCRSPPSTFNLTLAPISTAAPSSLQSYALWHKNARVCLSSPKCLQKPPVLIFNCHSGVSCGGFGDRLRGIHFVFLLAISTRRAFFINIPKGEHSLFPLDSVLHPFYIDWRPPSYMLQSISDTSESSKTSYGELNWSLPKNRYALPLKPFLTHQINLVHDEINFSTADFPLILSISSNVGHVFIRQMLNNSPNFQSCPDFQEMPTPLLLRHLTHALFTPSPVISTLISKHGFSPNESYTAVHARTGDDVRELNKPRFAAMSGNYDAIAESMIGCSKKHSSKTGLRNIFMASDSTKFKKVFRKHCNNVPIIRKVGTINSPALHVSQHYKKDDRYDENVQNEVGLQREYSQCEAFLNIFTDLYLLARADIIVATRSGFSKAAFFMGNASELYVGYSPDEKMYCEPSKVGLTFEGNFMRK